MPKISEYPAAGTLTGTERVLLNQGGVTKTAAASSLSGGGTSGVQVFNVKDYGALGNGVADDTTAIQAAIDAAKDAGTSQTGGTVYFPPGQYIFTSALVLPDAGSATTERGISLKGDAMYTTVLSYRGPSSDAGETFHRAFAIRVLGQTQYESGDFTLINDSARGTTVGIQLSATNSLGSTSGGQCHWKNVAIINFFEGVEISDADTLGTVSEITFTKCIFQICGTGVIGVNLNTINIVFFFVSIAACDLGMNNRNSTNWHIYGGTCSNNGCDFRCEGGWWTITGVRSEDGYFLSALGSSIHMAACQTTHLDTQDPAIDDNAMHALDLMNSRLTAINCNFGGALAVGTCYAVSLIQTQVKDTVLFRCKAKTYPWGANTNNEAGLFDTGGMKFFLQGASLFDGTLFPDQMGVIDQNIGGPLTFLGPATIPNGALRLTQSFNLPSAASLTSGSNAKDQVGMFMKNGKLVFAYNDGGTVTYVSLPLDGSTTTWSHGTTAP